jgi:hypothetical protein
MTLCDEAEIAWGFRSNRWEIASSLGPNILAAGTTIGSAFLDFSTSQPYWIHPLPQQFAWADNYVTAFGMLHPDAANAILTYEYPGAVQDLGTLYLEFINYHAFSHYWYEDTIEPGTFNTGGQTNANFMGFICSFEGGGFGGRQATNTYFYQDPNGLELNLVQTNVAFATNFLNHRSWSYLGILASSEGYLAANHPGEAVGQVTGLIQSTVGLIFNLLTGSGSGSQIQSLNPHPLGGPVPNGGSANNTPAYAWIPLNVPSNVVSMSFDFMLQGNGNNDSFQVALNGTNVLSLETILIQTNVTMNSGLINVSQYAGQQVELFLGIVGGTSTNAALMVSNFQFYVTLPPSLQIQLAGTNVVVTWPLSGAGYVLQSANKLAPPVSWTTVTNVPVIVNFQYTVTNQVSGAVRFYRLSE